MKKIIALSILASLTSFNSLADDSKQLFNQVYLTDKQDSRAAYYFTSHYYFAKQQNSGVWDDFGYLDTDSNIKAAYLNSHSSKDFSLSGEWFTTKEWFVTAGTADVGDLNDNSNFGFGYLFDDKLKLSLFYNKKERGPNDTVFKAEYNHQFNSSDYLGVTFEADIDLDSYTLSGRYFKHLGADSYLAIDVDHKEYEGSYDVSTIKADYYVNKNISLGVGSYDNDLGIQAKYFFNDKFHLGGSIIDFDSGEVYQLSFTAQY
ncbi:putative porin [Pseudoalteromonas phenolica]|uniref:Putative porin n=1 Tax=Pseudoalteromonas phenolica TaxID=161398 RepID=A0A5R9Q3J9_9GAMM|nr:putative porin [Pseudoalteromonas phenolica]TLX47394.1 putative porin [Pseudoalteromonas phenolica]